MISWDRYAGMYFRNVRYTALINYKKNPPTTNIQITTVSAHESDPPFQLSKCLTTSFLRGLSASKLDSSGYFVYEAERTA